MNLLIKDMDIPLKGEITMKFSPYKIAGYIVALVKYSSGKLLEGKRVVRIPFDIGDTVYRVDIGDGVVKYSVEGYQRDQSTSEMMMVLRNRDCQRVKMYYVNLNYINDKRYVKTDMVFTSEEEAKKALREVLSNEFPD